MVAEMPSDRDLINSQQEALLALTGERDRWRAVACNVKDGTQAAEAQVQQLKAAIEDYLLWEPGRKGHAAAHDLLRAALADVPDKEANA